jgi:hypothetical protein
VDNRGVLRLQDLPVAVRDDDIAGDWLAPTGQLEHLRRCDSFAEGAARGMKAIGIDGYDGSDQLRLIERPDPRPDAGEILVRVRAAGVDPVEDPPR